jgi:hypothetical protein
MRTKFLRRTLRVGLGVAAAATAATPAMAASPFLRDTATCPIGKVTIGGGSQVVGEGTADFRACMQESAPGTTGLPSVSLHLAAVRNGDRLRSHKVGVHAVCTRAPSASEVVRRDLVTG